MAANYENLLFSLQVVVDEGGIAEPGMHETEVAYFVTVGIKHCHTDVNEMTSLQGRKSK